VNVAASGLQIGKAKAANAATEAEQEEPGQDTNDTAMLDVAVPTVNGHSPVNSAFCHPSKEARGHRKA